LSNEQPEVGPDSIFEICRKNELKELFLVEDQISGFLEAYKNSKENKIKLIYGIRFTVCADMNEKNEDSLKSNSRVIVFCKNKIGYDKLIKVVTHAAREGFYYTPRIDFQSLRSFWDESELKMAIPFYDSFLHENNLKGKLCIPDLDFTKPVFFMEDNDVPFDLLIRESIKEFCGKKYETLPVKSIYYKNKNDFKAYLTFRCVNKRSTLDRPSLDHMCSDEFSFESWRNNGR
jgi:DNA polymerase-3 subunit alpha